MRSQTLATVATALLASVATLNAQAPGVGATQLVLQNPSGGIFTLRPSAAAGGYALQLPDMSGVPSVAGVLLLLDNSGAAPHPLIPLAPTPNSVLGVSGGGVVGWQTSLPSGIAIPSATITNPTVTGGTIDNTTIGGTTPGAGWFTTLSSNGASTVATGNGTTNTFGTGQQAVNTIGYGMADDADASTTSILGNVSIPALNTAYWQTKGNVTSPGDFIGTINAEAFEIRVNADAFSGGTGRVMRYEPNGTSANLTGGYSGNNVSGATTVGATIAGDGQSGWANSVGASFSTIGGGDGNTANAANATIAGGRASTINAGADFSTVGGGRLHDIDAPNGTIGGGQNNDIVGAAATNSTIGGGVDNSTASATTVVSGGVNNDIGANSATSAIGGGQNNQIAANATLGTIANGSGNTIASGAVVSTISGGANNQIGTDANNSTIGGGSGHQIGSAASASTIGGGFTNMVATSASTATISGGKLNNIDASTGTVGGGQNNDIVGSGAPNSTIGGGLDNSTASAMAVIAGGVNNDIGANSSTSTIGGGQNNQIADDAALSTIAGGNGNSIGSGAAVSTIGGGLNNSVSGSHSTIAGGRGLTLSGNSSFGFLGGNFGSHDMAVAASNTSVLGNTNLWLANNDGTARQLRLYEAESTTGAFPTASTNYTAFQAAPQSADITYTLPAAAPSANGQVMTATTSGAMGWSSSLGLESSSATTSALTLANSATGGTALEVTSGRVILSYGTVASGGTITNDVAVVDVADDGNGGTAASVTLPATGSNGQLLIVTTEDPQGVNVNAGFMTSSDNLTALRFVWVGGATGSWRREP